MSAKLTVSTVKEEPATLMRHLGLGGDASQRDYSVLYGQPPQAVPEEEEPTATEDGEDDKAWTSEGERAHRRELISRRRKALEDRIPTVPKPEPAPPSPKTRAEVGLGFLRRDIGVVVAAEPLVNTGAAGDGRRRGGERATPNTAAELSHARRITRLATVEGMLGLRRSGEALQPAAMDAEPREVGGTSRGDPHLRGRRRSRPQSAGGWRPAGLAFAAAAADARATFERERAAAAAERANERPPRVAELSRHVTENVAAWRPTGEKSRALSCDPYVPLSATPDALAVSESRRGGATCRGDPVAAARARVAQHKAPRALSLPEPCDFEEATRMGLHERLKEANLCARQLGLGTRYRTVSAGARSIRIEAYTVEKGPMVAGREERRNKKSKTRFVSVQAFMHSESRLMLQGAYGVGGNVFRAMRAGERRKERASRTLSAVAGGVTRRGSDNPRMIACLAGPWK